MRPIGSILAGLACLALGAAGALAAQVPLTHVSSIDLAGQFNSESGYGSNPLSIAFDGTNAYIGGYNNSGAAADIGVVKVSDIFGGPATFAPMPSTQFNSPNARGLDALAYEAGSGALLLLHDSGAAATSFIRRHNAASGALAWTTLNPQGARPVAMAIDPVGNAGQPGVGFLVQGSGRRRLLDLNTGATVFDGTNGAIVNSSPTLFGTAWRALAFDSDGNVALAEDTGFQYGTRVNANQFQSLGGSLNVTSSSIAKDVAINNVGQGVAILEDLGSDLLAVSGRGMNTFTDLAGNVTNVDKTDVHIRNLDGSTNLLSQISLNGDEEGIGTPWTGEIKNLAFGHDAAGNPVLLVVDFSDRRLDVYMVPEPALLGGLALVSVLAMRRRRRG